MDQSTRPTQQDIIQTSSSSNRYSRAFLVILLWTLVSAVLTVSRIANPGFGLQGDLPLHYHITRSFARSFAEGDWAPRWAGLLDGGYGDALFTFYPPLSYLMSAVLIRLFEIDILTSLKAVLIIVLTIAQAGAYAFARRFFSRRRAVVVALFYVLLPSFPMVGLNRGFFANALALGFVPVALVGANLMLTSDRRARALVVFALGLSAVILTHAITTYLCGIAIVLMILALLPRIGWRDILRLAFAGLFVFALTAFFLVPQRIEMKWVQIGLQLVQQDYRNYLLFAAPPDASNYRQAWAGLNQVASFITIAQSLMAIILGLGCRSLLRRTEKSPLKAIVRFGIACALFGLIISLPISTPLWEYLPGLKYIQFPWRFQPFVALGCGLLAAALPDAWPMLKRFPRTLIVSLLIWVVLGNLVLTYLLVRLNDPQSSREQAVTYLLTPAATPISVEEGRRIQNEDDLKYLPYAGNQLYFRPSGASLTLYPPSREPGGLIFVEGRGRLLSKQIMIAHREFVVECEETSQARLETYHYPHWVARIDDREVAITHEPGDGRMLVEIPSGSHRLSFSLEVRNPYERAARLLSIVSWILFGGWIVTRFLIPWERIRNKRK